MAPDSDTLDPRRWWTLAVLCLSLLIVFVGNSSLNVVIPTLSRELNASTSQLQWAVASYSLVFAGLLFSAGAIGDRFGRKGALQFGLLGFLVGVFLAAISTQMWQIIACRALMGGCAAFIMPSTLSILVNIFPPHERAKAIAIWAGVTGSAGSLGPVASGWMLGHFWYGSVFLVNVPVVIAALALGVFLVPRSKNPEEGSLDPVGAVLSIIGISGLVFALIQAPDKGWSSPSTIGAFAVAAVVMVGFVAWERRHPHPMLDIAYFRNPSFSTATSGMILVFMSMFGVMFLITQYFQLILGYSPLSASLRFLPIAPIMMIVAPLTPRLVARVGHNRAVAAGMTIVATAFLLFSRLGVATDYPYILLCVAVLIVGIALTMSPMTAAIMSAVPPERAGAGSAMNDATRELGAALGVAVLGSIAASRFSAQLKPAVATLSAADRAEAQTSLSGALQTAHRLSGDAAAHLTSVAQHAFVSGIHGASLTGAALALAGAAGVLRYLPRNIPAHEHRDGVGALEEEAELGLAGVMPVPAGNVASPHDELVR
ncbi:MAG: hypothetical protein QOJ00_2852 [Actinomycetota bacterium]|jgi:EmrB/QacA subfamily drug resistance transporter